MSDPVTNADIEDVLSSIRRLISEGNAPQEASGPASDGKLVLTPAFRVHDDVAEDVTDDASGEDAVQADADAEAAQETSVDTEVEQVAEPTAEAAPVLELVQPIAQPEDHADSPEDQSAAEVSDNVSGQDEDEETGDQAAQPDEVSHDVTSHEVAAEDAQDAEDWPTAVAEPTPETAAEGLEAVINASNEAWEPDGGEDTLQAEMLMFHAARARQEAREAQAPAADDEESAPQDVVVETVEEAPLDPAIEALVWEDSPPPPGSAGMEETPTIDIDPVEPAGAAGADRYDHIAARDADEVVGDDTAIIDEVYLRELVSRLVREELRGEVGEKITQSIRRMVRKEIERSLTLKSME
ncbi:hypothetical protein [Aliiroseovarius marinus]|uniref:hypothetical protein n=1 Tax=Aliiroseovarius marinus TaxID=2500159 RepID=UPI003D7D2384